MKNIKECINFMIDRISNNEDYNITDLAKKELDQLQAEQQAHNALRERLKRIEWADDGCCLICHEFRKHKEDCWLDIECNQGEQQMKLRVIKDYEPAKLNGINIGDILTLGTFNGRIAWYKYKIFACEINSNYVFDYCEKVDDSR